MVLFLMVLSLGSPFNSKAMDPVSDSSGPAHRSSLRQDSAPATVDRPPAPLELASIKRPSTLDRTSVPALYSKPRKRSGTRVSGSSEGPIGMVVLPAGTFLMGSPTSEFGRSRDERQWTVTLSHPFLISDHEVTCGEYEKVTGTSPGEAGDPGFPVVNVSWDDAQEFCRQLTTLEQRAGRLPAGEVYRLPTEAEWEYAARAGTLGPRHGVLDGIAWWAGNSGAEVQLPKGKLQNAYGLFDMIGNVSEWCLDRYGSYPENAGKDPTGSKSGLSRVVRGGSWSDGEFTCRSASRDKAFPESQLPTVGFRIVRGRPVSP